MTRILLTGSGGALGWYIKQYLKQCKQNAELEIACISRRNISGSGIRHFQCDLLNNNQVKRVLDDFKPELAILCAWETAHGTYWHDQNNIKWADATIEFIKQFELSGGQGLSFAGTCAEYEWSSDQLVEYQSPERPATLYGQQKLKATKFILEAHEKGIINASSCRIFFPYSARENEQRVTSLVVKSVLSGKPIHLRSGDVIRDICHTRHIARAMCELILAGNGGLFNMSTGNPLHLGRFLRQIAEHLGKEELVSWDQYPDNPSEGFEPYKLFGAHERVTPFLKVPANQAEDIKEFADEAANRFGE